MASVSLGIVMRGFFLTLVAAPCAVVLISSSALAESAMSLACRAYAASIADDYMSDELVRLDGTETAGDDHFIVHSYGRKYAMPRRVAGQGNVVRRSIGTSTREWGKVYTEERRRCLRKKTLGDLLTEN